MIPLTWPLRWVRGLLAGSAPRPDPHGPVWWQPLPGGRFKAGCRQCGCGEVFGDAATTRRFLAGHHAAGLVRAVRG